ncbi:MAG: ComEA family DNA-binding protein [Oscillospiraceae bacterium]|nr:ComEA family DNA-binding protein [Oscillospiraceae bacterium]MDE7171675.1 ComEA family DNA-binding protein [Oscillospiraceae bacterium]
MRLTQAGRRLLALIMTAGAVMSLCFAQRSTKMTPLPALPHDPPAVAQAGREGATASETIVPDTRVDINTAGLDELMTLPGIGEARAQAILDDREANGPYRYPENLMRVTGIGEGILAQILDQITAGGESDAQDLSG